MNEITDEELREIGKRRTEALRASLAETLEPYLAKARALGLTHLPIRTEGESGEEFYERCAVMAREMN